jgi:hypothetical protein
LILIFVSFADNINQLNKPLLKTIFLQGNAFLRFKELIKLGFMWRRVNKESEEVMRRERISRPFCVFLSTLLCSNGSTAAWPESVSNLCRLQRIALAGKISSEILLVAS